MPSSQLFSGTVAAGSTVAAGIIPYVGGAGEWASTTLTLTTSSSYAATSANTGIDTQIGYSIDGGLTYGDPVTAGMITSPSGSTSSQKITILAVSRAATHVKITLVNKDASNACSSCVVSYTLV